MISYKCYICELSDIKGEDVRNHIEKYHEPVSDGQIFKYIDCKEDVSNLYEHIFAKHASIRRLRKIPVLAKPYPRLEVFTIILN